MICVLFASFELQIGDLSFGTVLPARGSAHGLRGAFPVSPERVQVDDIGAFYQALRLRAGVGWTSLSLVTVSR